MKTQTETDIEMMKMAIEEAKLARMRGDYAIGAVTASRDSLGAVRVLAHGGNRVITKNDSTKHVELEILQYTVGMQGKRYLPDVTLYSTHAPCPMCLTACCWAKVGRIVYGASQDDMKKHGAKYGTATHKWRGTDIEPEQMHDRYLKGVHPNLEIRQLMTAEVVAMMQGKEINIKTQ